MPVGIFECSRIGLLFVQVSYSLINRKLDKLTWLRNIIRRRIRAVCLAVTGLSDWRNTVNASAKKTVRVHKRRAFQFLPRIGLRSPVQLASSVFSEIARRKVSVKESALKKRYRTLSKAALCRGPTVSLAC